MATSAIAEPLDLIRLSLDEVVFVRMKGERELRGRLHAFDQHMNLVLGDVEETCRTIRGADDDDDDHHHHRAGAQPVVWKTVVRQRGMLYVRGDTIVLVAPPTRQERL